MYLVKRGPQDGRGCPKLGQVCPVAVFSRGRLLAATRASWPETQNWPRRGPPASAICPGARSPGHPVRWPGAQKSAQMAFLQGRLWQGRLGWGLCKAPQGSDCGARAENHYFIPRLQAMKSERKEQGQCMRPTHRQHFCRELLPFLCSRAPWCPTQAMATGQHLVPPSRGWSCDKTRPQLGIAQVSGGRSLRSVAGTRILGVMTAESGVL